LRLERGVARIEVLRARREIRVAIEKCILKK